MKNPRAILMVAISIAVGVGAVIVASHWVSQQATAPFSKVVVAAQDIDLGTPLSPQMLKITDWPKGSVPAGAISDIKALDTRVVKTSLLRGELILESKLAPLGATGGLSAVISKGNRAMTVRVNDVIGVAGFALPGNYVDIVVNTEDESTKTDNINKSISKIVLEHILVLAVAQEKDRDETVPKVVNAVTLEVSPEQVEKLDLARSVGSLSLVLRNQIDTNFVKTIGSTKKNLLGHVEQTEIALPKDVISKVDESTVAVIRHAKPRKIVEKLDSSEQVEVIRGSTKIIEEFRP
jgi:pilus assembly protein CpaB